MPKYRIIVNPIAGNGSGETSIPHIHSHLQAAGVDYDLVRTERPWHAAELARQASEAGIEVVVSAGGDGTSNEVINGLMLARKDGFDKTTMGVLTVGRGNDFAFGMGIPTDVDTGIACILKGNTRKIDVGFVQGGDYPDGRYFGNGIGIGFDTIVGFEAAKLKLTGFAAYGVAALKTIFLYFHAPMLKIELDDHTLTQPALMVSIMNGRRMGGGFMMAPNGVSNDGLLDLCIVNQLSRLGVIALIPKFMAGTQATHSAVRMEHSKTIRITAMNGSLPVHADGETICTAGSQLKIDLLPQKIDLLVKA